MPLVRITPNVHSDPITLGENIQIKAIPIESLEELSGLIPHLTKCISLSVGRDFLRLVDKHFPKTTSLQKVFNRNAIKVSYRLTAAWITSKLKYPEIANTYYGWRQSQRQTTINATVDTKQNVHWNRMPSEQHTLYEVRGKIKGIKCLIWGKIKCRKKLHRNDGV